MPSSTLTSDVTAVRESVNLPTSDSEGQQDDLRSSESSLPPTDRGKDAYLTLMCCTMAQVPLPLPFSL